MIYRQPYGYLFRRPAQLQFFFHIISYQFILQPKLFFAGSSRKSFFMGDMSLIFSNTFSRFSAYFSANRSGGSTIVEIFGYLTQTPSVSVSYLYLYPFVQIKLFEFPYFVFDFRFFIFFHNTRILIQVLQLIVELGIFTLDTFPETLTGLRA